MQVERAYLLDPELDTSGMNRRTPAGSIAGRLRAQLLGQQGIRSHA